MTVQDYIESKGWDFKRRGQEIILRECPFCGAADHFYLEAQEGKFLCHKCQEKGNMISLKKHLGDLEPRKTEPSGAKAGVREAFPAKKGQARPLDEKAIQAAHERLLADPEALAYLIQERKLTPAIIEAFKLGLEVDAQGMGWVCIPHFVKGQPVNVKYRTLPPAEKNFRRDPGCPSVLFNLDSVKGCQEIFLTEGEIDCMTLVQNKFPNAIGTTGGAGSFDPSWVDELKPFQKIYLVYDPDEPGQRGAREIGKRLGFGRCFNVLMPEGQDVNEFFQKSENDSFAFAALVDAARQFDISGLLSIEQGFEIFKNREDRFSEPGLLTPWPSVNGRIKTGFQPGELVVLASPPKIGKSTWALQLATATALKGIPALFFCLEMRPIKLIQKIIQAHCKKPHPSPIDVFNAQNAFKEKPLYLGYCFKKPELKGMIETIRAAVQRYDLKFVVFDHLHFLCRSITNQTQEVSLAVQEFKFLAEEMEIPILLIAQPRKIQPDAIMGAMDLKDSISIYSDCDHLIILHRNRKRIKADEIGQGLEVDEAFEPITLIRVEASRYNAGGEAILYYHGEYSRFEELSQKD